jgi:hypothetical protein
MPQPPQLAAVVVGVSHPLAFGVLASQSAYPALHPAYVQPVAAQAAPWLWIVSHATPHCVQFDVVSIGVSQPFEFGGLALQSP